MLLVGIDPGLKGALAALDPATRETGFVDMPTLTERSQSGKEITHVDWFQLPSILKIEGKVKVILEKQDGFAIAKGKGKGHICPICKKIHAVDQTGSSLGNFLRDYGAIIGVLATLNMSFVLVRPQTWQSRVGASSDKDHNIRLAQSLYPLAELTRPGGRKPSDGRADALLLAHYGKITGGI